jgi:hypothetical protein
MAVSDETKPTTEDEPASQQKSEKIDIVVSYEGSRTFNHLVIIFSRAQGSHTLSVNIGTTLKVKPTTNFSKIIDAIEVRLATVGFRDPP